ncbi:MAG: methyltransferase, partial [Planctomycetaceae bacterium]
MAAAGGDLSEMTSSIQIRVRKNPVRRLLSIVRAPFRAFFRRMINRNRYAVVMWTLLSPLVSTSLYALIRLGVIEHLKDGPKSAKDLAAAAMALEQSLYRVLRALASIGFLKQRKDGNFELTPLSEILLKDHPASLQGMALLYGDVSVPNLTSFVDSIRTGRSIIDLSHDKTVWEFLAAHPATAESFDRQMNQWTALHAATVVATYDFSSARTIVDVGGGRGAMMREILSAQPQARGVILDRPEVVGQTQRQLEEAGLGDRCTCVGGDFFESVPEGADVYIIKHVLHDWDDEHAEKILRNIRQAMGPLSRLLIVEGLVEHNYSSGEFFRAWWDVLQLSHTLGRARTLDQM